MSTITLPNIRVGSDLIMRVRLKDNGVAIDWSTLSGIKAHLYSDVQRALAGRCDVAVDGEDPTLLVCRYAATKMQYLGENRIIVQAQYSGSTKTYDKPVVNFVRWTADTEGEEITIDDPDVSVEIEVEDVSSSVLDEAIYAALAAADDANEAATRANTAAGVSEADHLVAVEDHGIAEGDHTRAGEDHTRAVSDHGTAADDHSLAVSDHGTASDDHTLAASDHVTAGDDHTQAASDHGIASSDHTRAGEDHTAAANDHTRAGEDHTRAGADHTQAGNDHTRAGEDHTTAAADHTQAGEDHTQALADHEIVGGYNTRLTAVEGEVDQLELKVDDISTGKYYGYYATAGDLPDSDSVPGFAYVGSGPTYTIYNFNGTAWTSTGITVKQSPVGNDLDIDQDSNGKLQLADRVNGVNTSGFGYKILRRSKTFALQVTGTNTIYEIRDNFDLNGASLSVPSDSVLFFNGGKVSNGTITGNNTAIIADPVKIFDGITLSGTFSNASAPLNWWCVPSVGGSNVDVTADLQLAFDSPMREFVLNGIYSISSPVLMPSHSIIKGQGAETFKKFGFKALSGFTTKTIDDPRVSGRTWVVSGMFYHYYDYKPTLQNCFLDAQKNAKYCIEQVVGYSWCDCETVWLGNARFACLVQYACEQPIFNNLTCVNSHIGFISSQDRFEDGDIFTPSGANMGSNNIVQVSHCIIQGCNYGMVVYGGTNLSLHSCKFAYNSIAALVMFSTRAYVSDIYSEGDGLCNFWINPDTGEKTTAESGHSLAYLSEDSHVIGGVTTEGRLDGFTPAYDFKFSASASGVKNCYRSPFFFKETMINIESAFVSYINRGRGVTALPPTPDEKTYDGIDSIFLTETAILNLVNIGQYNHDNAGRNSMYAYVIDFVPSNTSQTLSMITSNATRRHSSDNNTKIIATAPCNGVAPDFVRIPGIGFKWGYDVAGYPTSGLNNDIESRLRGAGYDANHFKYNYKQNVFAGLIKNIPLYRKTITAGGLDGLYFRKEDLQSIFGNREQIKVVFYAKLLNDVASGTLAFSQQFSSTHYTHLVTKVVNCNITNGKAGDVYRIQQIVFLNPPQDANIDSTWNYLYLRNYSGIADTDIALSDILMYDVEDGNELAPVYESFYMTSGTTAKRPAATDVPVGFTYFDTDLGKSIVSNGTAWVNMDGSALA